MQNLMLVKVKYSSSSYTLSTERFTYSNFTGTDGVQDTVRITKKYNDEPYIDEAVRYLTERGHNVIGTDLSDSKVDYIVVASTDGTFKSISGKHEKRMQA